MQLRNRPALTLLELLVALVVINAGLLALVGTAAVLVRRHTELHARATANQLAANRLQSLAASPCSPRTDSAIGAFSEHWSEIDPGRTFRELHDSVAYLAFGTPHALALTTRLPC